MRRKAAALPANCHRTRIISLIFDNSIPYFCTHRITAWEPGKKVVWQVVDSQISFVADKNEWTGTDIIFEIGRQDSRIELRFTHAGLVPALACYGACADAWAHYINDSLFNLITTGEGKPERKEVVEMQAAAR